MNWSDSVLCLPDPHGPTGRIPSEQNAAVRDFLMLAFAARWVRRARVSVRATWGVSREYNQQAPDGSRQLFWRQDRVLSCKRNFDWIHLVRATLRLQRSAAEVVWCCFRHCRLGSMAAGGMMAVSENFTRHFAWPFSDPIANGNRANRDDRESKGGSSTARNHVKPERWPEIMRNKVSSSFSIFASGSTPLTFYQLSGSISSVAFATTRGFRFEKFCQILLIEGFLLCSMRINGNLSCVFTLGLSRFGVWLDIVWRCRLIFLGAVKRFLLACKSW